MTSSPAERRSVHEEIRMSSTTLDITDRRDRQPAAPTGIDWGRMVIVPLSVLAGAAAVGRMFVLARTVTPTQR
jgi:hypothetical protein